MQTKKKHSKRFTRTNWQPARWYQKTAFKEFVIQYTRGGLNMNPDNVYQYEKDGIKFQVLGEIYIVREDGSRMRIKRVQLPEGTPDPDFEDEEPVGTDKKYYFNALNGDNYFNNTINQEIETNKRIYRDFVVGNGRYRVVLDDQVTPVPNKAVVKIGILQGMGNSYPLYYRFTPGWQIAA